MNFCELVMRAEDPSEASAHQLAWTSILMLDMLRRDKMTAGACDISPAALDKP
jgi:hypothetical protein